MPFAATFGVIIVACRSWRLKHGAGERHTVGRPNTMTSVQILEVSEAGITLGFNDGEQFAAFTLMLHTLKSFTPAAVDAPVIIRQANFAGEGYPAPLEFVFETIPDAGARFGGYLTSEWRTFRWTVTLGSTVWHFGLLAEDGSGIWFGPAELNLTLAERLLNQLAHTAESHRIGLNWPAHIQPPN